MCRDFTQLAKWSKNKFSFKHLRMWNDKVSLQIVRIPLVRGPGVQNLLIIEENVQINRSRTIPERSNPSNDSFNVL